MGSYRLTLRQSAVKELESLPRRDLARVMSRIKVLADNPRPPACEKLSGQERYRVRQDSLAKPGQVYRCFLPSLLTLDEGPNLGIPTCPTGHSKGQSPD